MDSFLVDYLRHIGIMEGVTASVVDCEVCGGAEFVTVVNIVDIGKDAFGKLPIQCCTACGFMMQNPRFNRHFYTTFYNTYYRTILFGSSEPEKAFITDQVRRGELLYRSLTERGYLKEPGKLLDVGCSAGGLMVSFLRRGWTGLGTDPDIGFVNHGKDRLGLPLVVVDAEDMDLPADEYDLVIITGSLEHVYDANHTLSLCRRASKPGALLFLEGRALGQGILSGHFSHNHRRYLTASSLELLMVKHGWQPLFTTDAPLCGPTRPGGIYCLGRAVDVPAPEVVHALIRSGKRDDPRALQERLAAGGVAVDAAPHRDAKGVA
ncbi:class I SAM-dependent methyltransferase [Sorangium sp. So ce1128]